MIVSANGAPNLVFAVGFSLLGALIVTRRPRQPLGWLFLIVGLDGGVTLFTYEYAQYSLVTRPGSVPGGIAAGWLSGWVWTLGFPVLVTFCLLLYPDGKLPSPRWRGPCCWAVWRWRARRSRRCFCPVRSATSRCGTTRWACLLWPGCSG